MTVDDVRAYATTLPRVHEGLVGGRVKFYIGRIVWLAFSRDETVMGFAFPREWRTTLVESNPEKFMMPTGGDLRYNWVLARLDALEEDEMRELVLDAWAFCAPQRVLDEFMGTR